MMKKQTGFTLVEVSAAATIFLAAVLLAMTGYVFLSKNAQQHDVQNELNNDSKKAIERLKGDMRLSSINQIFYYPEGSPPYTAVSFPIAYDSDGDGVIERDSDGMIIWDDTVIYHIRSGSPDELVRTVLHSRNNALSDSQRQAQLNKIVADGNANSAITGGETATSEVIFRNLLNWGLNPLEGSFVCYAPTASRESISMGYLLLDPGPHQFQFTVAPRSKKSTSNRIEIDTLTISPSYLSREAEDALPATKTSGARPYSQYNASYSGKTLLAYNGSVGDSFTLTLDNDRWEDTDFGGRYSIQSNTVIQTHYDSINTPISADNVIELDGNKTVWEAEKQCGDYSGSATGTNLVGSVVRVLVKGSGIPIGGSHISGTGKKVRFTFAAAPSSTLKIEDVYFGESSSDTSEYMAYNSTPVPIKFNNGSSEENKTVFSAGEKKTSEWVDVTIDPEKNYIVSYTITDGDPMRWDSADATLPATTQIAIAYTGSSEQMAMETANWTTLSPIPIVFEAKVVLGLESMFASYAEQGTYTSDIIDTKIDSHTFNDFIWDSNIPSGTTLGFKIRTGNNPSLLDAASFDSITATPATLQSSQFTISGTGRYVQYQALLDSSAADSEVTPRLRNTAVTWTGQRRMMEISGTFSKGPDYGNFSLSVDGKGLQSALMVDLEIYKDVLGAKGKTQRISSQVEVALTPRNSGL